EHQLGAAVVIVSVIGALIIGLMARFGSERIRGHGIPEAIESILLQGSRVAPRLAVLQPLSAAISIGSGGPFGAEGPIVMTGGALGSRMAQLFRLPAPSARRCWWREPRVACRPRSARRWRRSCWPSSCCCSS